MKTSLGVCVAVLLLLSCHAVAVESFFDTFNGSFVGGPIGPIPAGWTFFGYGPPAWTEQETGLVLPPYDGTNSATRWNVPGWVGTSGTIALYISGWSPDACTLPGDTIDWTYPVYLKADVHAVDLGTNTKWRTMLYANGYSGAMGSLEWGNDGNPNGEWATLTCAIDPGQAGKSGLLVMHLDFDFTSKAFSGNNVVIWENVRIDYTPVPEPNGLLALSSGLFGIAGFLRRRV